MKAVKQYTFLVLFMMLLTFESANKTLVSPFYLLLYLQTANLYFFTLKKNGKSNKNKQINLTFTVLSSVVLPRLFVVPLSGTCKCEREKSWRAFTSGLSSSLCSDPVNDRERSRYSINPLAEGVEITRPSGLVAESFGCLRLEIGDKSNSGSEQLRPWISGLLRSVIGRVRSGGVCKSSVEDDSLEGACLALRNLARALCNLWYC